MKSNEGLMGSMFKAQVAFELFNKAAEKISEALKKGVEGAIEEQQVLKQTETVLNSTGGAAGMTAAKIRELAESLSASTTYEDEAIQSAENLLLTFTKVGKETFPAATQAILDVSTALNQDLKSSAIQVGKVLNDPNGMAAMRRVGVSFTDAQIAMGKSLFNTGHIIEYQNLVLKELNTEFGGSARAARDTFGGAVKALNRDMDDAQKAAGRYVIAIGRELVEKLDQGALSVKNFLESAKGHEILTRAFASIAATLSVAGKIIGDVANSLSGIGKTAFTDLNKLLETTKDKASGTNAAFTVLGRALNIVTKGFALIGSVVHLVLQGIDDLVQTGQKATDFLSKLGDALLHPLDQKKWDAVKASGDAVINGFAKFGKDSMDNLVDAGKKALDVVDTLTLDVQGDNKKMAKQIADTWDAADKATTKALNNMGAAMDKESSAANKAYAATSAVLSAEQKRYNEATRDHIKAVNDEQTQIEIARANEHDKEMARQKELVEAIKKYTNEAGSFLSEALGDVTQINDNKYAAQLKSEDDDYENKKKNIEDNVKDEAEKKKKLDALEKDHLAKQKQIQHQQFEDDRIAKYGQLAIDTILKTVEAFPNPVLMGAAIAAGALGAAAIATQVNPYAAGGVAEGFALVGEQGPELAYFANPTKIYSNADSQRMMGGRPGGGDFNVHIGNVSSDVDLDNGMRKALYKFRALRNKI
jgi:hypothetical protein